MNEAIDAGAAVAALTVSRRKIDEVVIRGSKGHVAVCCEGRFLSGNASASEEEVVLVGLERGLCGGGLGECVELGDITERACVVGVRCTSETVAAWSAVAYVE